MQIIFVLDLSMYLNFYLVLFINEDCSIVKSATPIVVDHVLVSRQLIWISRGQQVSGIFSKARNLRQVFQILALIRYLEKVRLPFIRKSFHLTLHWREKPALWKDGWNARVLDWWRVHGSVDGLCCSVTISATIHRMMIQNLTWVESTFLVIPWLSILSPTSRSIFSNYRKVTSRLLRKSEHSIIKSLTFENRICYLKFGLNASSRKVFESQTGGGKNQTSGERILNCLIILLLLT